MSLLQLNATPSRRELRWFAALWWPALCAVAGVFLFRRLGWHSSAVLVWSGGGLLALLGLWRTAIIQPIYTALMRVTFPIGWIVSHIVLAILYFAIFTPIGVVLRKAHDPMERNFDPRANSYWFPHQPAEPDRYFRQI